MKLNICQVLKCKKLESPDHIGTLCKKHSEILESDQYQTYGICRHPFQYKETNEKNNVWEHGIEHVRGIKLELINSWIKDEEFRLRTFKELVRQSEEKLADHKKTRNSRYHK
jgi:hypothetical protein